MTLLSCSSVFRAVSPVFLHHPHRAGALLLHLHIRSPGPPSVQAVPQSFGPCRGLTGHSAGGALSHLHQPGPGDRRGAPRPRGLGWGPPRPLKSPPWPRCSPFISVLYIEKVYMSAAYHRSSTLRSFLSRGAWWLMVSSVTCWTACSTSILCCHPCGEGQLTI